MSAQKDVTKYYFLQEDALRNAVVELQGNWTVASLATIETALQKETLTKYKQVIFRDRKLENLDTAAAWYLNELINNLKEKHVQASLEGFQDNHSRVFSRIAELPREKETPLPHTNPLMVPFVAMGHQLVDIGNDAYKGAAFLGEFILNLAGRVFHPRHLRLRSIVFHVNEVGLKAAPIIALMSFALSFVTAYQGAYQLQKFDATIFTIDLIALSFMRELGVLLVAIMLAGRSGSAFAAQLGTMKLNEEVDALQTMGVSPFEVLVLPRLLAILISLPLLTVISDIMGILGGYVYMSSFLNYSWLQYFSRLQEAAEIKHFYVGLSKAPPFAILIGIVGCMQGLRASGSAEEVGRRTITAVVQAIFLVILADAVFSVIFTKMRI